MTQVIKLITPQVVLDCGPNVFVRIRDGRLFLLGVLLPGRDQPPPLLMTNTLRSKRAPFSKQAALSSASAIYSTYLTLSSALFLEPSLVSTVCLASLYYPLLLLASSPASALQFCCYHPCLSLPSTPPRPGGKRLTPLL